LTGAPSPAPVLGRGISFGGELDGDVPDAGPWLEERHFDVVKEAGFDTVRLPVKWSAHMSTSRPYAVDAAFLHCVDWAVESGLQRDLSVVLNVHRFDELCTDTDRHTARYAGAGPKLSFEFLNEPHEPMRAGDLNRAVAKLALRRARMLRAIWVRRPRLRPNEEEFHAHAHSDVQACDRRAVRPARW
jgi:endoglucanase